MKSSLFTLCTVVLLLGAGNRVQGRAYASFSTANDDSPQERVFYHGYQLWKVTVDKREFLGKLKDAGDIKIWDKNSTTVKILVKPDSLEKVRQDFKNNNVSFEVVIEDLQKIIDEENPFVIELLDERRGHRLTWEEYHRLAVIYEYLDYLAETYPDLCSVKSIGKSVLGNEIKLLKVSNGNPDNKAIWVDGGIHAREWISPSTVTFIINQFVTNFKSQPASIQNMDWYFTPVLNPDGYEYSHTVDRLWRKNRSKAIGKCIGTDLNRNFGYQWGGEGASKDPCDDEYRGSGPFSEPETAAIERLVKSILNWKAYVSFHSYGQQILYSWGYIDDVPPDYKDLESLAKKAVQAMHDNGGSNYDVEPSSKLYLAAGVSDDWAKGTMNIKYAYTIELRDTGEYGFVLPAKYIQPTAREALAALKVIAEGAYVA